MPLVADGKPLNFMWLMLLPLGFLWLMLLPKLCDVADVIIHLADVIAITFGLHFSFDHPRVGMQLQSPQKIQFKTFQAISFRNEIIRKCKIHKLLKINLFKTI